MSLHQSVRQSFWWSSGLCQPLLTSKCKYVYSNEEFVWYLTAPSKDESSCRNNCDIWNVFRPRCEASNRSLNQLCTSFDKKEALYMQSVLFLYHFLFYCWLHQSTVRLNEHFLSLDLIIQKCDEYRMMLQDGTWNRYFMKWMKNAIGRSSRRWDGSWKRKVWMNDWKRKIHWSGWGVWTGLRCA